MGRRRRPFGAGVALETAVEVKFCLTFQLVVAAAVASLLSATAELDCTHRQAVCHARARQARANERASSGCLAPQRVVDPRTIHCEWNQLRGTRMTNVNTIHREWNRLHGTRMTNVNRGCKLRLITRDTFCFLQYHVFLSLHPAFSSL